MIDLKQLQGQKFDTLREKCLCNGYLEIVLNKGYVKVK